MTAAFERRLPRAVKKSRLPFLFFNSLEDEATQEWRSLMGRTRAVLEAEILNSDPDPEDQAIEGDQIPLERGAASGPLRKSTQPMRDRISAQKHEQEIRAFERRFIYGAPLMPQHQFRPLNRDKLLRLLTFEGGRIQLVEGAVKDPQEPTYEEVVVLSEVTNTGELKAEELRAVMNGKRQQVRLTKRPGEELYLATNGQETVFLARMARVPALQAEISAPEMVEQERDVGATEDGMLARTFMVLVQNDVYRVPSVLEPLAHRARRYPEKVLRVLQTGERSEEEEKIREKALNFDTKKVRLWKQLYEQHRAAGKTETQAAEETRKDPRWKRAEDLAETARDLAAKVEERWDGWRKDLLSAVQSTEALAADDGIELEGPIDLVALKREAEKGNYRQETDELMGRIQEAYTEGDDVFIMDVRGIWHAGEVTKVSEEGVRVRRTDGTSRLVADVNRIQTPEEKAGLDGEFARWYNNDMDTITIDRFKVLLPAGSASRKIEAAIEPWTAELNSTALKVDEETYRRNLAQVQASFEKKQEEARSITGNPKFRCNAPTDCVEEFIGKRELTPERLTGKGVPSIDKDTLMVWQHAGDELAGVVIEAREARSTLSQLEKWAPFVKAGEVQATWNSLGQPHGRYTADTPNLTNRVVEIRETVTARDGYVLTSCDLGQAEYVTWASLSNDPTLSAIFKAESDLHERMWMEIQSAGAAPNLHETTPRQAGKTVNFALLYRMQPFSLAKKLGISRDEAARLIRAWEERAPVAVAYREEVLEEARRTGQVSTKFGRTREIPELKTARGPKLHELQKTAWHHHNAGTAAELVKIKQIKTMRRIRDAGIGPEQCRIALQMFDEVILEVEASAQNEVCEIMKKAFEEDVPGQRFLKFHVDQRTGRNWREISK